ncbi:tRNA (adenosine(37)-N6)-threonylcarbamoyltransferase complex transferase subunit TsaD [Desulfotalea psychrophila]|nr:tRNA (adenosine(37)-N6)-threonylcarbamoyltransferase complex transferase subunit TsaD [Desulfotalea psychrophila]
MIILGIESSCDDTSAAVVIDGTAIQSNVISGQEEIHNCFGGVVPELASRSHLSAIQPVVEKALSDAKISLDDIDLIATTQGPGLSGSLLVGYSYAKSLSLVKKIPFVGVDHMAGHALAILLEEETPDFPFIALTASGGTSSIFLVKSSTDFELLGRTRDDAAGEAFDKVAKVLGLPYPGGPHIAAHAETGDEKSIKFPRAWLDKDGFDFSFSGLKTAVLNYHNKIVQKNGSITKEERADICASFQQAVIDVLVTKTINAARTHGISTVVLGGGVSSNRALRLAFSHECDKCKLQFFVPAAKLCTDNAAMIAVAGYHKYLRFGPGNLSDDVYSRSQLG